MKKNVSILFFVLLGLGLASISSAQICQNSGTLCNPTNSASLDVFVTNNIFNTALSLIGILAIGAVVYSGVRMIISQGNEEAVSKAKSGLQWSLIGIVVVLMAFVIVAAIGQFFQAQNINPTPGLPTSPIASQDFLSLSNILFRGILSIVGLIALLMIIVSGFRYLTARGDEEQTKSAKASLQWAVIGLVITGLAYVIVNAIVKLL